MKRTLLAVVALLFFLPLGMQAASIVHKYYDVEILNNLTVDNTLTADNATVSNLTITGSLSGAGSTAYRGVLARANTDNTVTTGVVYTVPLQEEIYDTDNIHSTTTDNTMFRVPTGVTKVRLYGQLYFFDNGPSTTNMIKLYIVKNGVNIVPPCINMVTTNLDSGGLQTIQVSSPVLSVVANDNLSLRVEQIGTNTVTYYGADFSGQGTWLAMDIVQ